MINVFTVEGNITQAPQSKQVGQNQVATFSIACHRNYKNKQTGEYDTDFFNVDVWGQQAQFVTNNAGKGDRVLVTGEMRTQTRTNQQGQTTTYFNVNASQVSLVKKSGGQQGGQGGYNQRPQNNYQQPPQQQPQAPAQQPQGNPFNQPTQGGFPPANNGFPPANNGFPQAPQAPQAPGNENIDLDDNDLPF